MDWLRNIWDIIVMPYRRYKAKQAIKRRLKQLQDSDPYIYK
jgi:hypothetical protein